MQKRAASVGFDWLDISDVLAKLKEGNSRAGG